MNASLPRPGATVSPPRGRRGLIVAVVVLAAFLIAAVSVLVTVLVLDEDRQVVALEPATAPGADPFSPSVAAQGLASEAVTASRTTRRVSGTTPGLYGGSRNEQVCDPAALGRFLAADRAKGTAWSRVLGISSAGIDDYLATLTPVVLTADTAVTNHGFADGRATSRQSVLQAGTAVLVDRAGVPRVRCSCGNPLAEPAPRDLSTVDFEGQRWPGYSPGDVIVVQRGAPGDTFVVQDIDAGDRYEIVPGTAREATDDGTTAAGQSSACGTVTSRITGEPLTVTPSPGVGCPAALALVEEYLREAPTRGEGSGARLTVGEWECLSTSAAEFGSTGRAGTCTSSGGEEISIDAG